MSERYETVVPMPRRGGGSESDGPALLRLDPADSVGVALRAIAPGEVLTFGTGGPSSTGRTDGEGVRSIDRVPPGHKVALIDVAEGERVLKYAQTIGFASEAIPVGRHVHVHNLAFRDSDATQRMGGAARPLEPMTPTLFEGYRRADGRVGTRNFIAVISSVNCSATVAHRIADAFDEEALAAFPNIDGVAAFVHGTGCGMAAAGEGFDNLQRVLAGYARHPNVGGVLMVGLGCEVSQIGTTAAREGLETGPLLQTMNIQGAGGTRRTVERGREIVREMLAAVNEVRREPCPASDLTLALQCGGSDAWSGITANPALGHAADLLVRQGGTAVLAETPEIYGAEHLLTRRASSPEVAEALMARIHWWQRYTARNDGSLDNNPSPGNKLGGLTTILEKSLGAVAKGGTGPLTGVYRYAEQISAKGFVFMDSPGYDPASVTGQIAGGCNLVAFTTGRGSAFGSKPAPCLKIATNTTMYESLRDDMDIDAGTVVGAGESIEAVGARVLERLLAVASGAPTLSESHGLGDHEFVPWQIGAVM